MNWLAVASAVSFYVFTGLLLWGTVAPTLFRDSANEEVVSFVQRRYHVATAWSGQEGVKDTENSGAGRY